MPLPPSPDALQHQVSAGGSVTDTLKTACSKTGAAYALFWTEQKGRLAITGCYAFACTDFIAKSCAAGEVEPGKGMIGRVFQSQGEEVIYDLDGVDVSEFRRKLLAKECGINTIACCYMDGGVLEYGSPSASLRRLSRSLSGSKDSIS
mmetsp:Transcript_21707/g.64650  ORF Transcript_21707/g.64650 Transcript_21707/m.64650 type:complete len:148 (+) Transcript_21707:68-511(+)